MSSCVFYLRWLEMYAVLSDSLPEEVQLSKYLAESSTVTTVDAVVEGESFESVDLLVQIDIIYVGILLTRIWALCESEDVKT